MKRKYPLKLFLFMVLIGFTFRRFYLFLPGLILSLIGISNKPCLIIGLSLLSLDLIISVIDQLQIRKASLEECDNEEVNELLDAIYASDDPNAFREVMEQRMRNSPVVGSPEASTEPNYLEKLVVYRTLNAAINETMTLDEMIDAFAEMCKIPVGDPDDLLFETGNYTLTGKKQFIFHLVRQFQFHSDDEYVQLRLEVTYEPTPKTRFCHTCKWGNLTNGDFFTMVRNSRGYQIAKNLPIASVIVRVEET